MMIQIINIIFEVFPSPKSSIKMGRNAIFGIGYIKYRSGDSKFLQVSFTPIRIPSGTPMMSEILIAASTLSILAPQ